MAEALRARAEELNVSRETIDNVSGVPSGYSGKVLGRGRSKTIGLISGPLIANAMGLRLVLIEDPVLLQKLRPQLPPRDAAKCRHVEAMADMASQHTVSSLSHKTKRRGPMRDGAMTHDDEMPLYLDQHSGKTAVYLEWPGYQLLPQNAPARAVSSYLARNRNHPDLPAAPWCPTMMRLSLPPLATPSPHDDPRDACGFRVHPGAGA